MHFSYVKEKREITEKIETGKVNRKRCMPRALACSFKRSCSIVKSRDELTAKQDQTEKNTEDKSERNQQEQTVETDSQDDNFTASEIQGDQSSQCSSLTEEEKAVSEGKVALEEARVKADSSAAYHAFQYKPAPVPERNRFQAGITFVDSQGYIYAQEVKEGEVNLYYHLIHTVCCGIRREGEWGIIYIFCLKGGGGYIRVKIAGGIMVS